MRRFDMRARHKKASTCRDPLPPGLEGLENRSLLSAYVFHDAPTALGVPSVIADSSAPPASGGVTYAGYGRGALALGDLNADGYGDYAVAAPGQSPANGPAVSGAVFVRSGRDGGLLYALSDSYPEFGVSMAAIGDVNSDGLEDIAVGSPRFDGNPNAAVDPAGRVWIFSGADGIVLASLDGNAAFDEFGASLARVEDLDNDGLDELLVGAPGAGAADEGQASIYSIRGFSVLGVFDGSQAGERFGSSVAAAQSDIRIIAIGGPAYDGIGQDSGIVRVYQPLGGFLYARQGAAAGEEFGSSLAILAGLESDTPASLTLVVGIPGADRVEIAGDSTGRYTGAADDRGAIEAFVVGTGDSFGRFGGAKAAGARFGETVANVGDLDGDGADDLGVLAPGLGAAGSASFFRNVSPGLQSVAFQWDSSVPSTIGLAHDAGLPGRGIGAVGDINNDGFPDVLLGDAATDASITGAYALAGPLSIDGASDNFSYAWSDSGPRPFLIANGLIRTYSKVPGLVQAPPGDSAADYAEIQGINNAGTIVFLLHSPASAISGAPLMVVTDGVATPIDQLVTTVEGAPLPDYAALRLAAIGNSGHLLLTGSGIWIFDDGLLSLTPFDTAIDINADGVALGSRSISGETVLGVWSRADGFVVVQGLQNAAGINDNGVVAGVLANSRTSDNPGHLATWYAGLVADLGAAPGAFPESGAPEWVIRAFDTNNRILADVRLDQSQPHAFYTTYLYEPGSRIRPLLDATHAIAVPADAFGSWTDPFGDTPAPGFALSPDGRILAYNTILTQTTDDAPLILRADSPTASLSAPDAQYFAGINQFGEATLFRQTVNGWVGERLSTSLASTGNTNLVMFTNPKEANAAFVVVADNGRMNIYSLTGGTSGGFDVHSGNRPDAQTPIIDRLTTFTNSVGVVHLVGIDASGDLIIYFLIDGSNAAAPGSWAFDNLSKTHLAARGQTLPPIVSNLTAFSTPWGTMHIAGLDAQGHAQIVWWGQDSPLWRLQDLTATAGDPRDMQGTISAFVTPWSTLHINGTDEQGRTVALWWAPGFGPNWRVDQLSSDDARRLDPSSITSYTTPWGGLNVVGRDAINGRVTAYWWSPESNVWTVEVLSVAGNQPGPPVAGPLAATAAPSLTLNVFAGGADGHATRFFWNPGDAGVWTVEDLSLLSTPF
jgi:glycosylphosphatidylinositol phospholipase D